MTSLPFSKPRPEPGVSGPEERTPRRALLGSIIDYAGLFPPAGLDMDAATQAYDRYRSGEHAWMLGAFVVPVARIAELAAALPESGSSSWPVSVLAPSLDARPKSHDGRLHIRALEIAPQEPKTILAGGGGPLEGAQVFYEVPLDDCMEARLDAIGRVGAASKVRTGGVVSDAFPAAPRLADFLGACAERGLAFKATAGLHHATHGRYALTYERGSPFTSMYGFLDLALVATLLRARRVDTRDAVDLLRGCGGGVGHETKGLHWCGHRMSFDEIAETRSTFFLSFGSCSFEEPVADLKRMGLL